MLWVCAASAAGVLLHAAQVAAWVTLIALALLGWRLAAAFGAARLPGGVVRLALGLALVAAVFARFHTLNGLAPGHGDADPDGGDQAARDTQPARPLVVIGGTLFLLLAACLYGQELAWLPLYAAEALLCCSALAVVAYTPAADEGAFPAQAGLGTREAIALAGRTLLYAAAARACCCFSSFRDCRGTSGP